jgi:Mor family transcriptional regulator
VNDNFIDLAADLLVYVEEAEERQDEAIAALSARDDAIRDARKRGMTVRELVQSTGLSQAIIYRILRRETGR